MAINGSGGSNPGFVGIGTTSPSGRLHVDAPLGGVGSALILQNSLATVAGRGASVNFRSSDTNIASIDALTEATVTSGMLRFLTASSGTQSERARIDSAGNVAIGTTATGAARLTVTGVNGIVVNGSGANGYNVTQYVNDNAITMSTGVSGSTAAGWTTNLAHVGTVSNSPLGFGTNSTERMRIDTSGNLLVGKTAVAATVVGAELAASGRIGSTLAGSTNATSTLEVYSTGAAAYRFFVDMGGTVNATSATISAISDIRLKENVRDLDAGLDTILALKPRRFDWKEGKGKDVKDDMGFIAQEVEEVLPALIGGWKAGEGEPDDLKSVKAGDLIPVLVKAIQELTARVAQLEGN
jgi:hypothetical protein